MIFTMFFRGANPNAKNLATDELLEIASKRKQNREKNLRENKNRIISLEKSKAMKKIKELKEKQERESASRKKQQNQEDAKIIEQNKNMAMKLSSPPDDLNPFRNDPYQDGNPFLLDSPVEAAFGEGNPFGAGGKLIYFID